MINEREKYNLINGLRESFGKLDIGTVRFKNPEGNYVDERIAFETNDEETKRRILKQQIEDLVYAYADTKIAQWFIGSEDKTAAFTLDMKAFSGKGYIRSYDEKNGDVLFHEYKTTCVKAVLRRDEYAPFGFSIVTAYPEIVRNGERTGNGYKARPKTQREVEQSAKAVRAGQAKTRKKIIQVDSLIRTAIKECNEGKSDKRATERAIAILQEKREEMLSRLNDKYLADVAPDIARTDNLAELFLREKDASKKTRANNKPSGDEAPQGGAEGNR